MTDICEKIEKAREKLSEVCDTIGWIVDSVDEQELNDSEILLEATVKLKVSKKMIEVIK